jgi:hypothetical protein
MIMLIVFIVAGLLWISTGTDPLLWLVRTLLVLRAGLAAAITVACEGAQEWWERLPAHIESAKQEVR